MASDYGYFPFNLRIRQGHGFILCYPDASPHGMTLLELSLPNCS